MKILRWLLLPFSIIYGAVVGFRNLLFDWGVLKSTAVSIPTICIGNLTVGGTGKTPHVEYVVELLRHYSNVATLSRGYKRKSKGFNYASTNSTVNGVGDEPLQIKNKFPEVTVAVDGDRVGGVKKLISGNPLLDVVILDDAFQHRYIKPGLSILLVDYSRPVWNDVFLPTGNLRDSFKERRRADIVVFTKSPANISSFKMEEYSKAMKLKGNQKVFFSTFSYGNPIPVFSKESGNFLIEQNTQAIAFSGIAKPFPFFSYVESICQLNEIMVFSDHHFFSKKEIQTIFDKFSKINTENKVLLTTEKDAMRIRSLEGFDSEIKSKLFYIPVTVEFLGDNQAEFNNKIISYVRAN
jgi:tetraacyldisaccharide 4'-kinase